MCIRDRYQHGARQNTQYDKPGDPPSLDCTMNATVLDPLAEPMIHKAFPAGIAELREYVMEVAGAKDHWVKNINDKTDTRWEYTCLLYTSPSPRDRTRSRMPSSA